MEHEYGKAFPGRVDSSREEIHGHDPEVTDLSLHMSEPGNFHLPECYNHFDRSCFLGCRAV